MGVWAFYNAHSEHYLNDLIAEKTVVIEPPVIDCTIEKSWYYLHIVLTHGLTKPTQNNILSNAIAGELFWYGDTNKNNENDWKFDVLRNSINSKLTVKEISSALAQVNFIELIEKYDSQNQLKGADSVCYLNDYFEILKKFYQTASEEELAVLIYFSRKLTNVKEK